MISDRKDQFNPPVEKKTKKRELPVKKEEAITAVGSKVINQLQKRKITEPRLAAIMFLSQVQEMENEKKLKEEKLDAVKGALGLQSPQLTGMPRAPSPPASSLETKLLQVLSLGDELGQFDGKIEAARTEIQGMIVKMEDPLHQITLTKYYLQMMPLKDIARDMKCKKTLMYEHCQKALAAMETVMEQEGVMTAWMKKAKALMNAIRESGRPNERLYAEKKLLLYLKTVDRQQETHP